MYIKPICFSALLIGVLVACSYSTDENSFNQQSDTYLLSRSGLKSGEYLPPEIARVVCLNYISTEDKKYVITIDADEAEMLGISPDSFKEFITDISSLNTFIEEKGIEADMDIVKEGINKYFSSESPNIINTKPLKTAGEASGIIPLYDNTPSRYTISVPIGSKFINIAISSAALLGGAYVGIYYGEVCTDSDICVTPVGIAGNMQLELPASASIITVQVCVTSANGGWWSYTFS